MSNRPFSKTHAEFVEAQLMNAWVVYLAQKKVENERPTLLDFFAWLFYSKGWQDSRDNIGLREGNAPDTPDKLTGPTLTLVENKER